MRNSEIIEKLRILGIYSSKQLIEKNINYWWQLQYQISKDDQENLYLLNEALADLNEIDIREIISILDTDNISDNQSEENSFSNNFNDNQEEYESFSENNKDVSYEYLNKAIISMEREDYEKAIEEASLGINFNEKNDELYAIRCIARLKSPTVYKNHLMLDDICKAIDLDPLYAGFYETKAQLLFEIVFNKMEYIDSYISTEDIKKLKEAKKNIDITFKLNEKEGEEVNSYKYILRGRIKLYSGDIKSGRQDILLAKNYAQNSQNTNINDFADYFIEIAVLAFKKYFGDEFSTILENGNISDIQKRWLFMMEKDLNLVVNLNKDLVPTYFLRGRVKKLLNKHEESTRDFKIFKAKDPSDSFGLYGEIEDIEYVNNIFWRLNKWLSED